MTQATSDHNDLTPLWLAYKQTVMPEGSTRVALRILLQDAWTRETSHPLYQSDWRPGKAGTGQFDVTALIVQDLVGGDIVQLNLPGVTPFCFNRIPVGEGYVHVDLTDCLDLDKFNRERIPDNNAKVVARLDVLRDGQQAKVRQRYELLRDAVHRVMAKTIH